MEETKSIAVECEHDPQSRVEPARAPSESNLHRRFRPALWMGSARTLVRIGGLVAVFVLISTSEGAVTGPHRTAVWGLLILSVAAWTGWTIASQVFPTHPRAGTVSLAVLGIASGILAVFSPWALAYLTAIGLEVGSTRRVTESLRLVLIGPVSLLLASWQQGHSLAIVAGALAGSFAGLALGAERRQSTLLISERATFEVERERGDLLAERNGMAREIHDVLAHTLGSLAVHLDALEALAQNEKMDATWLTGLHEARILVKNGLDETRRAVRALRADPIPLVRGVEDLVNALDASLDVVGSVRPLSEEANLTLYRAVQEALSNVRRHAPGTHATVCLRYETRGVLLSVINPVHRVHKHVGVGYGLRGMRERAEILQGWLQAGSVAGCWKVEMWLPV